MGWLLSEHSSVTWLLCVFRKPQCGRSPGPSSPGLRRTLQTGSPSASRAAPASATTRTGRVPPTCSSSRWVSPDTSLCFRDITAGTEAPAACAGTCSLCWHLPFPPRARLRLGCSALEVSGGLSGPLSCCVFVPCQRSLCWQLVPSALVAG